jgi:hypothetical protein
MGKHLRRALFTLGLATLSIPAVAASAPFSGDSVSGRGVLNLLPIKVDARSGLSVRMQADGSFSPLTASRPSPSRVSQSRETWRLLAAWPRAARAGSS